ncbi:MAG: FAD-binding protein, partial [Stellaceae bacterium]
IDRLAKNGIDLTRQPVEVAPIAHYHMGGIRVGSSLETRQRNLFAAGEAIGGANGANRLSGNAISEALVFGRRAGLAAAARARESTALTWHEAAARASLALVSAAGAKPAINLAALITKLQHVMESHVGPFRSGEGLAAALEEIGDLAEALGAMPPGAPSRFDPERLDWFDARNMLLVAEAVTRAALSRRESRGAHQREDFPATDAAWRVNQALSLDGSGLALAPVAPREALAGAR